MPSDLPTTLRRLPRLVVGLAIFGLGVALMARSDLGLSPWDVLHQGIANQTPISFGIAGIATSAVVLLAWIPLRQRPGIGTLANALLIGLFIDLFYNSIATGEALWLCWIMLLGGIALIGLGTGIYIGVHLGPGPRDGLMTGLAARGMSIRIARTLVEGSALLAGWLCGGTLGLGTIVFTLTIGPAVQFFMPRFDLRQRNLQS